MSTAAPAGRAGDAISSDARAARPASRCGRKTRWALLGRGHLGDGVVDFGPLVAAVLSAGYPGFVEIEIFNQDVWDAPADETAATVRQRFARLPD